MPADVPPLPTRPLGETGISLTELGLGCAAMTGNLAPVSEADITSAIDTALACGVRYLDTAPLYGFGRSEHFVGEALRARDGDYVLSTKVGRLLSPGQADPADAQFWHDAYPFRPRFDYSYDAIMRSYEDSLGRLGLPRIDILLLHDIGEMEHGVTANRQHFADAMDGGYRALDELRRNGDIKAIGLGVNEREVCLAALDHGDWDCFLLAGRYTLLEQDPVEDLLPACARSKTSLIIGGPFNSGILGSGTTWNCQSPPETIATRAERLGAVCRAHGIPLIAAAIQFPLGCDLVSSVIPGPRSGLQARELAQGYALDIPSALWADLRSEALLHPDAPTP